MKALIRRYDSKDEKRRLEIYDHQDGFFSFEETHEAVEDIPGYGSETYWSISHISGLYDSLDAADRDAKASIPWLRDGAYLQTI